ncbi:MAG: DUF2500 domain-containing protein [Clostridiales bacterium]|nr:DUF2500 domain-containing protein [Clostridiales bacterium]
MNTNSFFFGLFPILFLIIFALVIGMFVVTAIRGVSQWHRNNHSPRLTVAARVVSKREEVHSHHHHQEAHLHTHCSTSYYATFEVESGDRLELAVSGEESGMLLEGDQGLLTFQGTRFLGFERQ